MGHSGAGKTTIGRMFRDRGGTILCDDRMILRRWPEGFRLHGSWCHGGLPAFSADSEALSGIFFIEQGTENRVEPLESPREIIGSLLRYVVRPLATADWWEKTLMLVERIVREVPCYRLRFDLTGGIVREVRNTLC